MDDPEGIGYAFLSHGSACEALRVLGANHDRWPKAARMLPVWGDCVCGQRAFARLARHVDLRSLGVVTSPVDVLVPNAQYRRKGKHVRAHPWSNPVPANGMLRVHRHVLVSSPEFVMLQLANVHVRAGQSAEQAVTRYLLERDPAGRARLDGIRPQDYAAWDAIAARVGIARTAMEFVGTYRLGVGGAHTTYDRPALTRVDAIRAFAQGIPASCTYRHTGAFTTLRDVLPWVLEGSASPMETDLALMLTLPRDCGGCGMPKPQLNAVPKDARALGHRVDMLWEDQRVVVEYESNEFHAGKGAQKVDADITRANGLRARGYTVLEITPGLLLDKVKYNGFVESLGRLLGMSLPHEGNVVRFRCEMLYALLFSRP